MPRSVSLSRIVPDPPVGMGQWHDSGEGNGPVCVPWPSFGDVVRKSARASECRLRRGPAARVTWRGMPADGGTMDKTVALCNRRGFVFPSSEIYGGIGSPYDYGHYGVLL